MKLHTFAALMTLVFLSFPVMANKDLATKSGCMTCHQLDKKLVGPSYYEVGAKYKGQADAVKMLTVKVKAGGKDVWGPIPMPPNPKVSEADIEILVKWILSGAK